MKRLYWILAVVLVGASLVLISCDDNSRTSFGINIATVIPEGDNAYSLLLDNGERLWPSSSATWYTPTYNQRVFLNYTILQERGGEYAYDIRVNEIWNVLTKEAIELTAQNEDSIGNDPVKANAMWVGGDYLNVSFMFNYGGIRPHAINLVENTLSPSTDPDAFSLELRHNSYDSQNTRMYEGFVCFDLKPLRVEGADSINLSIKVEEWAGNKTFDVVYRYNQPAISNRTEMPIPVISSNEYY